MVKYQEDIDKLSKTLIRAGRVEYTPERIEKEIEDIMQSEGLKRKVSALAILKSKKEVRQAINAGVLNEVKLMILSKKDGNKRDEDGTPFIELYLVLERSGKPEYKRTTIFDNFERVTPLEELKSYKAKINLGDGLKVTIPEDVEFTSLEDDIFSLDTLYRYSDSATNLKPGMAGVWNGRVGSVDIKQSGTVVVNIYGEGAIQPITIWYEDESSAPDVRGGDDVIIGGYQAKRWFYASFVHSVPEPETTLDVENVRL